MTPSTPPIEDSQQAGCLPRTCSAGEMTLQQYLTDEANAGMKTEFRIVASKERSDKVQTIYIHPLDKDGRSLDFAVDGNILRCLTPNAEAMASADTQTPTTSTNDQ